MHTTTTHPDPTIEAVWSSDTILRAAIREAIHDELDARDARLELLAIGNDAKTTQDATVTTGILYLTAGKLCPWADSCRAACLLTAGRGCMAPVQKGRERKTALWHRNRVLFWLLLARDVRKVERQAQRDGTIAAVRVNGTSDLPLERFPEAVAIMTNAPIVQFYDYTKAPYAARPARMLPANYDLTRSRGASTTVTEICAELGNGRRVAVVFGPDAFREVLARGTYLGLPVVNGKASDYRPRDGAVIVALKATGAALKDDTGFVVWEV